MELTSSVSIDAPPATVWRVLTDFERYPEWNPFLHVVGRPNEGARLAVEVRPPGNRTARFRPTVTHVERGRELRWLGHLVVPGLYDGEHRFVVEPDGDGTRFTQSESFGGVLVGPVNGWLGMGEAVVDGFAAMNAALKARAESSPDEWGDANRGVEAGTETAA